MSGDDVSTFIITMSRETPLSPKIVADFLCRQPDVLCNVIDSGFSVVLNKTTGVRCVEHCLRVEVFETTEENIRCKIWPSLVKRFVGLFCAAVQPIGNDGIPFPVCCSQKETYCIKLK